MFDLTALGTQLVKELSVLIEQNVIVTDKNGFIIASTDPARVNTYHEGASIAMKTRKELAMTAEMTAKLQGVRPGIVLPIVVSDTPIGVIGITGVPVEIEKYAKLVRKVAELFVTEFLVRQERERGIREVEFFVFDLFTTESSIESIEDRAKVLNLNISDYSRVAIIQTNKQFEIADVENLLHMQTIDPRLKIVRWGLEKLILLIPNISKTQLESGLKDLTLKLKRITRKQVSTGIGDAVPFYQLRNSFRQAEMAVIVSAKQKKIVFEEELKLELLFYSLQNPVREEFLRRTIEPLKHDGELLTTLKAWLHHTGSLQELADHLHIHKNTLKYRLKKVEDLLNINLNNKEELTIVYTAVELLTAK